MTADYGRELLPQAYEEAQRALRVRYLKVGCLLMAVLHLSGVSLDYLDYPSAMTSLFRIRAVGAVIALGIFAASFLKHFERVVIPMGLLWALGTQASICFMIWMTDGARSPYYAGLNLLMLGAAVLLPWTFIETLIVCVFTMVMYSAACIFHPTVRATENIFFSNLSFLIFTNVICATCSFFSSRKRFRDFQLQHELDCRNRELLELDRVKSDFFANISHELRTPLTLIVAPLDQVIQTAELAPGVHDLLETARKNSLRLLKLINDLLEFVRLEDARANISKEVLDLNVVLPGLIDSVRHLALNKGLKVLVEEPGNEIKIDADPARFEKIVLNLLMNAIKFTDRGGAIVMRWKQEGAMALIEIEDNGIGIAPRDLPIIFERFRQADSSSTRKYQGSGIGLALARELVQENGGSIDVRSALGKGSSFIVRLPLSEGRVESGSASSADDPIADIHRRANRILVENAQRVEPTIEGRGDATILIVDDEPDMRRFVAGILAREYKVVQADNGPSGLEALARHKPDLAILDLMLPGMDGLELCSKMRADPVGSDMRIILLTARLDEAAKLSALDRGANDFITKPFSSVELMTRVSNLIRSSKLEREIRAQNVALEAALKQVKETEAQLIQSEKMNALGGLAAGLLHEINNPLNYTMMALQITREGAPKEAAKLNEGLNDIEEGMARIRDIILELRSFATPAAADAREEIDLAEISNTAIRLVSHELDGIRVERDLKQKVRASKTQIIQVLVNLVLNSAQSLQTLVAQEKCIRISSHQTDQRVYIRVWDNGAGIAADVLPRVFEPFFTTRPVKKGTGLGLSVCHTIIKNHQGDIQVRSEPGKWTEVGFDLPSIATARSGEKHGH